MTHPELQGWSGPQHWLLGFPSAPACPGRSQTAVWKAVGTFGRLGCFSEGGEGRGRGEESDTFTECSPCPGPLSGPSWVLPATAPWGAGRAMTAPPGGIASACPPGPCALGCHRVQLLRCCLCHWWSSGHDSHLEGRAGGSQFQLLEVAPAPAPPPPCPRPCPAPAPAPQAPGSLHLTAVLHQLCWLAGSFLSPTGAWAGPSCSFPGCSFSDPVTSQTAPAPASLLSALRRPTA